MGAARPPRSVLHFANFGQPHDIHLGAFVAIDDGGTNAANGDDVVYHADHDFSRGKFRSFRPVALLGGRRLLLHHPIVDFTIATKSGQSRKKRTSMTISPLSINGERGVFVIEDHRIEKKMLQY